MGELEGRRECFDACLHYNIVRCKYGSRELADYESEPFPFI